MHFVIFATDKPDARDLRIATRPPHAEYLRTQQHRIVNAGSVLNDAGEPQGSMLIITAESQEEAEAFAAGDPFAQAGLFASCTIRPFRMAFKDGERV